jgi:hypothetical protein
VAGGKEPACPRGCKEATTDPAIIKAWWRELPLANIGVATGLVSGFFAVDVDGGGADDGADELRRLERELGKLMRTVEVLTARGRHLWFRNPAAAVIRNSAGKIAPGIDIRGDGGYVLAPPSRHPCGKRYCWSVDSSSAIAEAPAWLIERACAPANGNGHGTPPEEWRTLVTEGVSEGRRNISFARLAGHLLRRYVDPVVVLELLLAWNMTRCSPPLPTEDIHRIVDSIAGRELRRRGGG